MTPETPLTEVAQHLPRESASLLMECDSDIQTAVLMHIRALIVYWETQRYVFDPIAYEGVLMGVVAMLIPLHADLISLKMNIRGLSFQLAEADDLIRRMTSMPGRSERS